jgi:ATP-dependent 26S proteasome regulatory subunit
LRVYREARKDDASDPCLIIFIDELDAVGATAATSDASARRIRP